MLISIFENGYEDTYVAYVLNDHGLWDGVEMVHLSTRSVVRVTSERSHTLNYIKAKKILKEGLIKKGGVFHG